MLHCSVLIRLLLHRSEEHTSELQSLTNLVCRLLLEKKNQRLTSCRRDGHAWIDWFRPHAQRLHSGAVVSGGAFIAFFFNETATTEIYTLSLHDALPI